ncbi:hypothetical protein A2U01_0073946, partial [Trifolium medium]|nr:hypothetical protein [Trifolium medium]
NLFAFTKTLDDGSREPEFDSGVEQSMVRLYLPPV